MFERYTEHARRAVFFARYEATKDGSERIGTEHLLRGIFRENKKLISYLFPTDAFKEIAAAVDTRGKGSVPSPDFKKNIELSEGSKRVILKATQEANSHSTRSLITSGDLLVGILLEQEDPIAQFLTSHGANIKEARQLAQKKERGIPIIGRLLVSLRRYFRGL